MSEVSIYKKAGEKWGKESQIIAAIEELAEASAALAQYLNGKKPIENVHEELADAEIMLEQMHYHFDSIKIAQWKVKKLDRLEEILK